MFHKSRARICLSALSLSVVILGGCASRGTAPQGSNSPAAAQPLTAREKQARFEEIFSLLDTNHDGFLSREELRDGLRRLSQHNPLEATGLVYSDKIESSKRTKKPDHLDKLKKLTRAEQDQLIARAFVQKGAKDAAADQERISKEEFRKIVITPDGEDQGTNSPNPNPWESVL